MITPSSTNYVHRVNNGKSAPTAKPEVIDALITQKINGLAGENENVWNSPQHNRREYLHSFFQYPAMMVPLVQKTIVDIIHATCPEIKNVIDPFVGSGTSLVACMQNGLKCYGQDINPLAVLIAKTRTGPYLVEDIIEKQELLYSRIDNDKSVVIEATFPGISKWFKSSIAIELSKIVRAIRQENEIAIRRFYWVNLAETIRLTSNDRTSTFKLHARPAVEIDQRSLSAINEFTRHIKKSVTDLQHYRNLLSDSGQIKNNRYKAEVTLKLLDSSINLFRPQEAFFDLLVTSPPYGDNKTTVTYGQHSYLPLQWIDMMDIDSDADPTLLKSTLEIDSRSLGGKIFQVSSSELDELFVRSSTLKSTFNQMGSMSRERINKVMVFFRDLDKVLANIFSSMKTNSYQVWTIGNRTVGGLEIPNGKILTDLIESRNGKLITKVEREILNKRMARRNQNSSLMNHEDILIFRKLG